MDPRYYIHTVNVTRSTNTPDPPTKRGGAGSTGGATGLQCLIEGARSPSKNTAAGDFTLAAYVMTWTPVLTGGSPGPFLVADDIVTFRGSDYLAFDIVDDTLRPRNPYMTCKLKAKK